MNDRNALFTVYRIGHFQDAAQMVGGGYSGGWGSRAFETSARYRDTLVSQGGGTFDVVIDSFGGAAMCTLPRLYPG